MIIGASSVKNQHLYYWCRFFKKKNNTYNKLKVSFLTPFKNWAVSRTIEEWIIEESAWWGDKSLSLSLSVWSLLSLARLSLVVPLSLARSSSPWSAAPSPSPNPTGGEGAGNYILDFWVLDLAKQVRWSNCIGWLPIKHLFVQHKRINELLKHQLVT